MKSGTSVSDLNEYLFMQLDALSNDDLEGEQLDNEIKKSKAIAEIGKTIIENNKTVISATKLKAEYGVTGENVNQLLIGTNDE